MGSYPSTHIGYGFYFDFTEENDEGDAVILGKFTLDMLYEVFAESKIEAVNSDLFPGDSYAGKCGYYFFHKDSCYENLGNNEPTDKFQNFMINIGPNLMMVWGNELIEELIKNDVDPKLLEGLVPKWYCVSEFS
jgi:hypothetical protein